MSRVALATWIVFQWLVLLEGPTARAADSPSSAVPEATKPAEGNPDPSHISKELQAELRKQCEADAKRLCHFVIPGGGRIFRCLESHNSDLSTGCRQALSELNQKP